MKWRFWLPLLTFAGILGLAAYQLNQPRDDRVVSRMVGQPLPYFDLPAAIPERPGITSTALADGQPRLLNIWASWCPPCIAEAPHLETLQENGAVIVGVAIRDRSEDVARFLERHGNPYAAIGLDDLSSVQIEMGASGVPETFVVNADGVITYQHIGDVRASDVGTLLAELEKAKR